MAGSFISSTVKEKVVPILGKNMTIARTFLQEYFLEYTFLTILKKVTVQQLVLELGVNFSSRP